MFSGVLTIEAALTRACRWYAKLPALLGPGGNVSYGVFEERTRRIAAGYRELGVGKGDRVAFLSEGCVDHMLAYYAAHWLGGITVNLHYRETFDHQAALLDRLEPALLVYAADKQALVDRLRAHNPALRAVRFEPGDGAVPCVLDLIEGFAPLDASSGAVETDPAVIQLSSGSTGVPKALVHTHSSVLETWSGGLYMWAGISPSDRFLNAFSPSFAVWLVHAGSFLNHGAGVAFQSGWDPSDFLATVETQRITCAALTPTQWRMVLAAEPERYDLGSLRMAAYLGEKMAPEQLRSLSERVCPLFCSFYGMSECLGIGGCVIRSHECLQYGKWGSVGRPSLNSDLRIADRPGRAGPGKGPDEVGEIVVRAASFAVDNWGDPDWRDRVVTEDGWYRTGDLGYYDTDGYVYLVGRADNLIATGGIKVAAEEVERVLETNPDIVEVMVAGEADEAWGQRIVAFVVPRHPGVTADGLDAWCRSSDQLPGFKKPKAWRFVDALPLNSVGKRDRKALKSFIETI